MKKKIHLLSILLLSSISIFAQTQIKELNNASSRFIPGTYMKDGSAAIYFSEDEYGYDASNSKATIYDFDLNLKKSFDISTFQPYTITESRATTGTTVLRRSNYEQKMTWDEAPSCSDMLSRKQYFAQKIYDDNSRYDPTITVESILNKLTIRQDSIFFVSRNEQYSFYFVEQGLYLAPNNWFGTYSSCYTDEIPVYKGEWSSQTANASPLRNLYVSHCYDVANLNDWNGGVFLPFSQTFFNDDDKFEYIRYIGEISEGGDGSGGNISYEEQNPFGITSTDRDGDGEVDYRSTFYGVHYKGFEVVTEDGDVLYTFKCPYENVHGDLNILFYKSNDNILVEMNFDRIDGKDDYGYDIYVNTSIFFRIDKKTNGVTQVKEENNYSIYPNPAKSGTPINVSLPLSNKGRTIEVVNMGGSKVISKKVAPNETTIQIPTSNLNQGAYIISLNNGNFVKSKKIIVQ